MDEIFRVLKELGVVETAEPTNLPAPWTTIVQSLATAATPTVPEQVPGRLENALEGLDEARENPPKSQPSLFRKALAFALVDKLSTAVNLADQNLALFLAEPDQAGVPGGKPYPKEVTNYQTFLKTDVMQTLDNLSYSLDGNSYFEYLAAYLRNVVGDNGSDQLAEARKALLNAKVAKDQAYNHALTAYTSAAPGSSLQRMSLIEALEADPDYAAAWKTEQACEDAYTKLQGSSMVDFASQLDIIKNADDRLVPRNRNNMPCIAISDDYIHDVEVMAGGKLKVDPKDIYYRPFYNLPNLATICNDWQSLNTDPSTTKWFGPISIALLDAQDQSWSELGHTRLDSATKQTLTVEQQKVLKQLQISLMFEGDPAIIDVDRGFWDVPNFRTKLPSVAATAPQALKRKICKTIKVMLAWSIKITIKLPTGTKSATSTADTTTSSIDLDNLNLSFLKLGLVPDKTKPDEIVFSSGSAPYPLLLAVLAQVM